VGASAEPRLKLPDSSGILGLMWRAVLAVIFVLVTVTLLVFPARSQGNLIERLEVAQTAPAASSQPQQGPSPAPNPTSSPQITPAPPPEEASGVTVVLDPAHGGNDFGARGPTGLSESDVVLDFARAARIALEAERLRVLLTREGNQDPSFDSRSALVNGLQNAIFVSLHVSSSGPVGSARTYYYTFPSDTASAGIGRLSPANPAGTAAIALPQQIAGTQPSQSQAAMHPTLVQWDQAQRSSKEFSRQLATLVQNELVQRLKGSPSLPIAAPVRQLRTIAAPAIAIELSSIDVTDSKRLEQMAQPLAEAISKAVAEFHYPAKAPQAGSEGSTPAANSSGGH
jgi:N-acetylmuramoyl-L-alanine amidase